MVVGLVVGLVLGVVVGAALGGLVAVGRASRSKAAADGDWLRQLGAEVENRQRIEQQLARAQALLDAEHSAAEERRAAWEEAGRALSGQFARLSDEALQRNSEQFLQLADVRLGEARQAAAGDLDQRRQAIDEVLVPLREQLVRYEQQIRDLELARQGAYSGLQSQVRELTTAHERLQAETRNLVTALRAPATRGRWGELQLRRVVEMAGMVAHCDFDEQVVTVGPEGRLRPDLVVRLPGAKQVVVDAKVPLQAFLDAHDAGDESERVAHLAAHARQLRAHVDALSKKEYWAQFDSSPEFVVAFVPGDLLLAAALEHDPGLLEHAFARHVVLATPTTLVAMLRTVAYTWQQESLAASARQVQQLGQELYRRLGTFGSHLAKAGRGLSSAVEAYNQAVGSLERSVLPQARRFQDLGVIGTADKALPELEQLDATARRLQAPELGADGVGDVADDDPPADQAGSGGEVVHLPTPFDPGLGLGQVSR